MVDSVTTAAEDQLAVLGHEMRNPLSALSYALEAWPKSTEDRELMDHLLEIMKRQVAQLTRLSDDLMDTARIARGMLSIHREPLEIRQVIAHACEEVKPFIERCGHTLTAKFQLEPMMMCGDESRLQQVFSNLIQNAAKFTQRNGKLFVTLEQNNRGAIVRVRDNGRGISAAALPNIFNAPAIVKGNPAADNDGLGIGLRLVKSIVELHGGTVEAFSKGLGQGSIFAVQLPIVLQGAPLLPSPPTATKNKHHELPPPYHIVVVDDDRSMGFLMSRLLQKIEQSVTVANSGEMAIQIVLQERPQIVFLDLVMHGMSGFDVARQLRSRADLDGLVLIALSGNADENSKRLALEAGFDRYLVKPTSVAALTETLLGISVTGQRCAASF